MREETGSRAAMTDMLGMARANLRELARKAEEIAVIVEEAGYQVLPGEIRLISRRIDDVRQALETGQPPR